MPLLLVPTAVILLILVLILCVPLSVWQRYRIGTSRQRARSWLAVLNVFSLGLSALIFLVTAAVTANWVPRAFTYSLLGLLGGALLGLLGIALTRWEHVRGTTYYTQNRWLILGITVAVAGRIVFGIWRSWETWHAAPGATGWLATSGLAGSMAAGALVIGYYLSFSAGVWIRIRQSDGRNAMA